MNAYFRIMEWIDRRRRYALPLLTVMVVLGFIVMLWMNDHDRTEANAEFLEQCRAAGYDAAKCRFFLTATRGGNNAAAVQMIIQSATH